MADTFWEKTKKEAGRLWNKAKTYIVGLTTMLSSVTGCTPPQQPADNAENTPKTETAAPNQKQDEILKKALIEKLAEQDAVRFTELQGKHVHDILEKLKKAHIEFDKNSENMEHMKKYVEKMKKYKEESGYNAERSEIVKKFIKEDKIDSDEFSIAEEELENKYKIPEKKLEFLADVFGTTPIHLASELCGFAKGQLADYCQALQKQAAKLAAREMMNDTLGKFQNDMGWTCQFAQNTFQKNGFGTTQKISDCYTKNSDGKNYVSKDKDGKPLVKDGDLALLLDKKGKAWHCVRINVGENGEITYSAGNEDRNHDAISKLKNCKALIIPTQDYAKFLASEQYSRKTLEELQSIAQQNNLAAPIIPYSLTADAASKEPEAAPAGHSRFAGELKRDAKYTLNGTLPPFIPTWLKEEAAAKAQTMDNAVNARSSAAENRRHDQTAALSLPLLNSNTRSM